MPKLQTLDPMKARGIKSLEDVQRKPLTLADIKTRRYTTTKTGRLLPLNSAAWRKLRAQVLAEQPLCPECEARGELIPALEVHHKNDNPDDNSRDNLVGLCRPCHSRHTAADMGKRVNYGCDVDGVPLDPDHPWRQTVELLKKSPGTDGHKPTGSPRAIAKSNDR